MLSYFHCIRYIVFLVFSIRWLFFSIFLSTFFIWRRWPFNQSNFRTVSFFLSPFHFWIKAAPAFIAPPAFPSCGDATSSLLHLVLPRSSFVFASYLSGHQRERRSCHFYEKRVEEPSFEPPTLASLRHSGSAFTHYSTMPACTTGFFVFPFSRIKFAWGAIYGLIFYLVLS